MLVPIAPSKTRRWLRAWRKPESFRDISTSVGRPCRPGAAAGLATERNPSIISCLRNSGTPMDTGSYARMMTDTIELSSLFEQTELARPVIKAGVPMRARCSFITHEIVFER